LTTPDINDILHETNAWRTVDAGCTDFWKLQSYY